MCHLTFPKVLQIAERLVARDLQKKAIFIASSKESGSIISLAMAF